MTKIKGSNKRMRGSVLAKIGRPAKAGKRRGPKMMSFRDDRGRRQWTYAP